MKIIKHTKIIFASKNNMCYLILIFRYTILFLKKTPDMLIRQENTTGNYLPGITTIPVMTDLIYGDKWCRNINA